MSVFYLFLSFLSLKILNHEKKIKPKKLTITHLDEAQMWHIKGGDDLPTVSPDCTNLCETSPDTCNCDLDPNPTESCPEVCTFSYCKGGC